MKKNLLIKVMLVVLLLGFGGCFSDEKAKVTEKKKVMIQINIKVKSKNFGYIEAKTDLNTGAKFYASQFTNEKDADGWYEYDNKTTHTCEVRERIDLIPNINYNPTTLKIEIAEDEKLGEYDAYSRTFYITETNKKGDSMTGVYITKETDCQEMQIYSGTTLKETINLSDTTKEIFNGEGRRYIEVKDYPNYNITFLRKSDKYPLNVPVVVEENGIYIIDYYKRNLYGSLEYMINNTVGYKK
jgi:hypothetical protein